MLDQSLRLAWKSAFNYDKSDDENMHEMRESVLDPNSVLSGPNGDLLDFPNFRFRRTPINRIS